LKRRDLITGNPNEEFQITDFTIATVLIANIKIKTFD
jgi:hypothetical protein